MSAACQLGVFDLLGEKEHQKAEASAIAQQNEWDADNTERMLNALAALGLVNKVNGTIILIIFYQ